MWYALVWEKGNYSVMDHYAERRQNLKKMGYKNYPDYLKSKTWKNIKRLKLAYEPDCYGCGREATEVHHGNYAYDTMKGYRLENLFSVCRKCHEMIEFKGGLRLKCSPEEATENLRFLRENNMSAGNYDEH